MRLKLIGIDHTNGQTIGGRGFDPELRLATPSGQLRAVTLAERDLIRLIIQASEELDRLRLERDKGVR